MDVSLVPDVMNCVLLGMSRVLNDEGLVSKQADSCA